MLWEFFRAVKNSRSPGSHLMGQHDTQILSSEGEAARQERAYVGEGRGEEEVPRGRGEGRRQVISIEMCNDLVSLVHSHPPSHNISSTSGQCLSESQHLSNISYS